MGERFQARLLRVLVVGSAITALSCSELPSALKELPPEVTEDTLGDANGSASATDNHTLIRCFRSRLALNDLYLYDAKEVRVPNGLIEAAKGTQDRFLYGHRLVREADGRIQRVVNCDLPLSEPLVRYVAARIRIADKDRPIPGLDQSAVGEQASLIESDASAGLSAVASDGQCLEWGYDANGNWGCLAWEIDGVETEVCTSDSTDPECDRPEEGFEDDPCDSDPSICSAPPSGGDDDGPFDPGDGGGDSGGGGGGSGPGIILELTCGPLHVIRGGTVSCMATIPDSSASAEIVSWKFEPNNSTLPDVVGPSSGTTWGGTVVTSGFVKVTAQSTVTTSTKTAAAGFYVDPRSWTWGTSDWTHGRGNGSAPASWDTEPDWDASYKRAQLCSAVGSGCGAIANPFIYPDFRTGAGYSIASVNDAGPNHGIWYVTSADVGISTKSWVNDGFLAVWQKRTLPEGAQADECRAAMGLGPTTPVSVNFNTFNGECEGKDMVSFVRAVLDHEEDHHHMVTAAAAQTANNGPGQIEGIVGGSESTITADVDNTLTDIDRDLRLAGDATEPTGNWSSTVWIWKSSVLQYIESGLWVF